MAEKLKSKINNESFISEKFQHPAAILVIFLSLIFFFNEVVFDGRVFISGDSMASKSFETLANDAKDQNIFPLWNPYIFCGMPGYASLTISGERTFDISAYIFGKTSHWFGYLMNNPDLGWQLFYYFLFGIGVYSLVFYKLQNKLAALLSSLGVLHSTFVIILITVGHMTKIPVIAFFPFILLILEKLRIKFNFVLSLILVLLIHFMYLPGHLQMIFYVYFAIGIYFLFYLILSAFKKEILTGVFRAGLIFSLATGISFAMTSDQYLSILEYSKYSIRGSGSIALQNQANNASQTSTQSGGLDYDYATSWSFDPTEVLSFVVPSIYGFGNHTYKGALSQNQSMRLNTYFGPQPFTDAPQYMGIAILILAAIGIWQNRKNSFVQYSVILILISLLISFGRNSIFYDAMFNYFPYFNKFRIPSMILILIQIMMPILAGYGFKSILENDFDEKCKKRFMQFFIASAILFFISFVGKEIVISIYQTFFTTQDLLTKFQGADQNTIQAFYTIISEMVATDVLVAFLISTFIFGGIYFYLKNNLKQTLFTIIIIGTLILDLWRINYKPYETHPKRIAQQNFSTPQFVSFLKQDTTLYRTLEFEKGQPPYNNSLAYWRIQSAYGYQGAKMRQIQDMYDVVGIGNPLMWSLMNVKYIISDKPDSNQFLQVIHQSEKFISFNRTALPRAFFVNSYKVKSGIEILNSIRDLSFNPIDVAFFMEEPNLKIEPATIENEADFTKYGIQDFEIKVKASGNNLLFISETWYPKGWKAYLDENEIPIHRLNYMFRGVVISKGEHILKMKFEPENFYLGKNLSLWINIIIILLFGYFIANYFLKKNKSV